MQAKQCKQYKSFFFVRLFPEIFDGMPSVSDQELTIKLSSSQMLIVQSALSAFADLAIMDPSNSIRRYALLEEIQGASMCINYAAQLCLDELSPIASVLSDNSPIGSDDSIESDEGDEEEEEEEEEFQQSDGVLSADSPIVRRSSVTGGSFKETWKPRASKNDGVKQKSLKELNLPKEPFRSLNCAAKAGRR